MLCDVSFCVFTCVASCSTFVDVVTGRRLLVADGVQIVYRKRVLMDRGDTFPFTIGSGVYLHHCVAFIRDMDGKFLYGKGTDGEGETI